MTLEFVSRIPDDGTDGIVSAYQRTQLTGAGTAITMDTAGNLLVGTTTLPTWQVLPFEPMPGPEEVSTHRELTPLMDDEALLGALTEESGHNAETPQVPNAQEVLESRFNALAEHWRSETGGISLTDRRVMHPDYQHIIGLGAPVIPIILRELQVRPDHWFWALRSLTGENPVQEEDAGRLQAMAGAWITWGKEHGYLD